MSLDVCTPLKPLEQSRCHKVVVQRREENIDGFFAMLLRLYAL